MVGPGSPKPVTGVRFSPPLLSKQFAKIKLMIFSRKFVLLFLVNWFTFLVISFVFWNTVWSETFYADAINPFLLTNFIISIVVSSIVNKFGLHIPLKQFLLAYGISIFSFIIGFYGLLYHSLSKSSFMF